MLYIRPVPFWLTASQALFRLVMNTSLMSSPKYAAAGSTFQVECSSCACALMTNEAPKASAANTNTASAIVPAVAHGFLMLIILLPLHETRCIGITRTPVRGFVE